MLSQAIKKVPISRKISQNLFHLRYDLGLIGKRHFVTHALLNDISWAAKVGDNGDGAGA